MENTDTNPNLLPAEAWDKLDIGSLNEDNFIEQMAYSVITVEEDPKRADEALEALKTSKELLISEDNRLAGRWKAQEAFSYAVAEITRLKLQDQPLHALNQQAMTQAIKAAHNTNSFVFERARTMSTIRSIIFKEKQPSCLEYTPQNTTDNIEYEEHTSALAARVYIDEIGIRNHGELEFLKELLAKSNGKFEFTNEDREKIERIPFQEGLSKTKSLESYIKLHNVEDISQDFEIPRDLRLTKKHKNICALAHLFIKATAAETSKTVKEHATELYQGHQAIRAVQDAILDLRLADMFLKTTGQADTEAGQKVLQRAINHAHISALIEDSERTIKTYKEDSAFTRNQSVNLPKP
jgi:hypothetical protein